MIVQLFAMLAMASLSIRFQMKQVLLHFKQIKIFHTINDVMFNHRRLSEKETTINKQNQKCSVDKKLKPEGFQVTCKSDHAIII